MDVLSMLNKQERPKLKPCCKGKKPWMEGTLTTTNRDDYQGKEVPVERGIKRPDGYNIFGDKFDGSTTMGGDYKPWEVKRQGPILPTNTDMGGGGQFNGASTYNNDFGPKETAYQRVKAKSTFVPNKAPLESVTTHRDAFQPREVPAVAKAVARATNIPTSAGPFEGHSLYKDTFQRQPYAKRQPVNPKGNSDVIPNGKFDDGTMYNTSFVPKELSRSTPARPQDANTGVTGQDWFGGPPSTEYRGQFPGKEVPVVEPNRPAHGLGVLPSGAFNGMSTSKADYVPFATTGATKMIRPSPAFESNNAPFNGQSTYQSAFVPQEVPYERVRPKGGYQPNTAPFDGTTTHRAAFVPLEVQHAPRMGARHGNIGGENHPFEGQSTYKGDYKKMPGTRTHKIVPKNTAVEHGPFDGTTTYGTDFIQKEIPAQYVRKRDDECESCVDGVPGVTCREFV